MACDFLNNSIDQTNQSYPRNWNECFKGLDEYISDEQLAQVQLFFEFPKPLLQFAAACTSIFMIISIPGNIITIAALSRYKKVRNATAIFIINLSVSDLLFSILTFPITIQLYINQNWTTGRLMCRIHSALLYDLTGTSLFTVVGITVNRYVMVSHPLLYPKLYRKRNLAIWIIVTWMSAFSCIVPPVFEVWGRFSLDPQMGYCDIIDDTNGNSAKNPLIIFGIIFPSFLIIACYTRIIYIVKKSTANSKTKTHRTPNIPSDSIGRNQEISAREPSTSEKSIEDYNSDDGETNSERAVTKFKKSFKATFRKKTRRVSLVPTARDKRLQSMIMAIGIAYFTCHLPFMIVKTMNKWFTMGPYGQIIGIVLLNMTVCINPLIYVVISKEYREAYKNILRLNRER